jgi:formamidopyrimidine-DNA glycosylase
MPELPDLEAYRACLTSRIVGHAMTNLRVISPFVVRTFDPLIGDAVGKTVREIRRLGKRIVLGLDDELFLVIHLMIAGRFGWKDPGTNAPAKIGLASFEFAGGTLILTEASPKKRASIHCVRGESALAKHDPGGAEPLEISVDAFDRLLRKENHTIKRSLTDPRLLAGIGNAYSDEILHAARISPVKLTAKLTSEETQRLHASMNATLRHWIAVLKDHFAARFPGPGDITAFRPDFAVHGKFGKPCPVCGRPVQRIRYAENETNYCAECQTGGRVLADRSLSRLLKDDWPRSIDEWTRE